MTGQPRTPRITAHHPEDNTVTLTWDHSPADGNRCTQVHLERYDRCEDCRWNYTWHRVNTPAVCYDCAPFRAYAALPWWRRWTSRKPRA